MKSNLKEINLKYEELAEEKIANTSNILFQKNIVTLEKIEEKLIEEEKKLKKSDVRYSQLIECMQEGFGQIDRNEKITFVNLKLAEILGYTPEEIIGKYFFDFMDDENKQKAQIYLKRRRKGIREQYDFEFLKKDGSKVFTKVESAPIYDENGNYNGAIGYISDITEKKKIEDELKESEENLAEAQKITKIGSFVNEHGQKECLTYLV